MADENIRILVDADALPRDLKTILQKIAEREKIDVILVSAQWMRLPESLYFRSVTVPDGWNAADDKIVEMLKPNDIVITADIPLADRVISGNGHAINPRGECYTAANIKNRMAMRELMEELRITGEVSGGPAPYSEKHKSLFMNALHKLITRYKVTSSIG